MGEVSGSSPWSLANSEIESRGSPVHLKSFNARSLRAYQHTLVHALTHVPCLVSIGPCTVYHEGECNTRMIVLIIYCTGYCTINLLHNALGRYHWKVNRCLTLPVNRLQNLLAKRSFRNRIKIKHILIPTTSSTYQSNKNLILKLILTFTRNSTLHSSRNLIFLRGRGYQSFSNSVSYFRHSGRDPR